MGVVIRPAGPEDMASIGTLFREYAASLSIDLRYQGFEAELASLPGAYAPPNGASLLALLANGTPAGCVALRRLGPDTCEMKRLYVRPVARGLGAGRALVLAAIEAGRVAGYAAIFLDTLPDMLAAQALYRDLGFEAAEPYYASPVAGTLFMRKALVSHAHR
jgi:ribosomal protein S18 acetylase RimI-like enzyme